jgi:uncharacterized protein (DUF362 family)/NAD-dependent dihydropyrimidine dehydrogenase PreA subunit
MGKGESRVQAPVFVTDASYDHLEPVIPRIVEGLDLGAWCNGLSGKTVFVKPNMIGLFPPHRHATTHPLLVSAIAQFFQEAGARVIVGDNCGVGGYGLNQKVAQVTEIADAVGEAYKNIAMNSCLISLDSKFTDSIAVSRDILEADVVINVPKMKTHSLTVVTGAVKNMFGIVTGAGKSQCHRLAPAVTDFSELLAEIYSIRPPDLTIMDGIVSMEGDGPTSGTPKRVGKILASTNAVALDAVMCRIMGLSPEEVHHLRYASQGGLGPIDAESIEIVGEKPQQVPFKLPMRAKRFTFLSRLINWGFFGTISRSKLVLDKKLCKKCNICVEGCPTKAMQMDEFPEINEERCIRCLCCQELCPESAWKTRGLRGRFQRSRI